MWDAWTDPESLASWWLPAPTRCRVERLDTVPGGAFVTSMSDDGVEFVPHLDACFLAVEAGERIVFTNAVDGRWRPAAPEPVAMTAEITLRDHPDGTDYRVVVRHCTAPPDSRKRCWPLGLSTSSGWSSRPPCSDRDDGSSQRTAQPLVCASPTTAQHPAASSSSC